MTAERRPALESSLSPEGTKLGIPQVQPRYVRTEDGFAVAVTVYEPEEADATALISPATAAPQRYYRHFAYWLAERGVRAVTYDYRGVGRSGAERARELEASLSDWARRDASAVVRDVLERYGPEQLVLVGHSFGGQLLGLVDELHEARGALLVGAQLGHWRRYPGRLGVRMLLLWRLLVPLLVRRYGYLPGRWSGLGMDLPKGVAREWQRWALHPDYLMGVHGDARDRFGRFPAPIRAWSFTDDEIAPAPAVAHLLSVLPPSTEHVAFAPSDLGVRRIGHFGCFRPRFRSILWEDALAFVRDVGAGPRVEETGLSTDSLRAAA